MKFSTLRDGGIAAMTMFVSSASAAELDCASVFAGDHKFDLSSLKGTHYVLTSREIPPKTINTTYKIDICGELNWDGVGESQRCAPGTRVCAIQHQLDPAGNDKGEFTAISIAGKLSDQHGGDLDPTATFLNTSDSNTDSKNGGVQLTLNGGRYPLKKEGIPQQVIIDFVCDPEKNGSEGEWHPDEGDDKEKMRKREDGKNDGREEQFKDGDTALQFLSYGFEGDDKKTDILRMKWYSKAGCKMDEGGDDKGGDDKGGDDKGGDDKGGDDKLNESQSWGFFTWIVIL